MNRSGHDNLLTLTCLITCVCALYVASTSRPGSSVNAGIQANPPGGEKNSSEPENDTLNRRVENLTRELEQKSGQPESVMTQLQGSSQPRPDIGSSREAMAVAMAQVEAPTVTEPSVPGVAAPRRYFNQLSGPDGEVIATDVTFSARYGRRLAFRDSQNRPFAVDIDAVHPGVLGHLGIKREDALKDVQRDLNARKALAQAANQRRERREELARREAQENAEPVPGPSMTAPTQVTHVNVQSAPAAPVYSQPATVWTYQPHWRAGHRRSWNPGFQVSVPVGNSAVATFNSGSSQAPYSPPRYPFNNGFRFTRTGPYTSIPGY